MVIVMTAVAGVAGTGLGGLLGVLFTRNSEKIVSLLLSFAGGVMLCIVCLDLLSDALGQAPDSVGNVFLVIGMTLVGFGVIYGLNAIIDKRTNKQVKHIDKQHPNRTSQHSRGDVCRRASCCGRHEKVERDAHHGGHGRADHSGRNAGLFPGHAQSRMAVRLAELCERRNAVCRIRRTSARVHPHVAVQSACVRHAHRTSRWRPYSLHLTSALTPALGKISKSLAIFCRRGIMKPL